MFFCSEINNLSPKGKQVAADFVAVYVAEQYRHLLGGKGRYLGRRHNWDDAHLQVTLLAAVHAGQSRNNMAMFYKGRFVSEVYHQSNRGKCVYQKPWNKISSRLRKRRMNLTDYWQFNKECDRSGVNITRRDFEKFGDAITGWLENKEGRALIQDFNTLLGRSWTNNVFEAMGEFYVSNKTADSHANADQIVDGLVNILMLSKEHADEITKDLKN